MFTPKHTKTGVNGPSCEFRSEAMFWIATRIDCDFWAIEDSTQVAPMPALTEKQRHDGIRMMAAGCLAACGLISHEEAKGHMLREEQSGDAMYSPPRGSLLEKELIERYNVTGKYTGD